MADFDSSYLMSHKVPTVVKLQFETGLSHLIDQMYQNMNPNYRVHVKIAIYLVPLYINTHLTPADLKLETLISLVSFH